MAPETELQSFRYENSFSVIYIYIVHANAMYIMGIAGYLLQHGMWEERHQTMTSTFKIFCWWRAPQIYMSWGMKDFEIMVAIRNNIYQALEVKYMCDAKMLF